jgi:hypothetical protein
VQWPTQAADASCREYRVAAKQKLDAPLPQDRIDVQSFIWVVGEYTVEDEAAIAASD